MQHSISKWQIIFTALALVVAAGAGLTTVLLRNTAMEQPVEQPAAFSSNSYNTMKTDTFAALVTRAYGSDADIRQENGVLTLELKNSGEQGRDFFNANEALLRFRLSQHGFELQYQQGSPLLTARFKINEQNGVTIPNDVLIRLMDKTTGTYHVDKQK
ncbi:hypothetical protein [Taibaiella koreensis]|uniref:hypothetical protein n=1 Tax=Taibaiella koreensis TaxID=1268548 RepID=UPI000E59D940|nr:hypothetical protein [Taibaiella koreensis]